MALTLDDFKQFALDNAGASDNGQAPPAQPMPNINPSMGQQIAQSINSTPNAPPVTQVQPKEGPIKSFLTQFIHGAGQGLLSHVGLQTDAERQQVQFNQAQQVAEAQRAQQGANDLSAYRKAQTGGLEAKATELDRRNQPFTIPNDPSIPQQLRGQQTTVGNWETLSKFFAQNQGKQQVGAERNATNLQLGELKYGDGETPGPLNTQIKDIGGRSLLLRKGTGEVLKDLGTANSITTANARAEAMARYGLTPTMDEEGNPTSVSRLDAIINHLPSVTFDALKTIGSDKVGIQQYEDILKNKISPNLTVLNDPTQRAIIALAFIRS